MDEMEMEVEEADTSDRKGQKRQPVDGNADEGSEGPPRSDSNPDDEDHQLRNKKTRTVEAVSVSHPDDPDPADLGANGTNGAQTGTSASSRVMNNKLVMEQIAKKLPVKKLFDLRQTCALWNLNFIPAIEKNHSPIRLDSNRERVDQLISIIRSSSNCPFARYKFDPNVDADGWSVQKNFIDTFQNTITDIECPLSWELWEQRRHGFESTFVADLRSFIFNRLPQLVTTMALMQRLESDDQPGDDSRLVCMLPKLKRIQLCRGQDGDPGEEDDWTNPAFTQLMSDVFNCASELESLHIRDTCGRGLRGVWRSTLSTPLLRQNALRNLKTLEIWCPMAADLQILIQFAQRDENLLRLNSLSIYFSKSSPYTPEPGEAELEEASRLLHSFLTTQSQTLKQLTLDFEPDAVGMSIRIPRMENVVKLGITDSTQQRLTARTIQFEGRAESQESFIDTFPELRRFSYNKFWSDKFKEMVHPGVTELQISSKSASFVQFGPVFPSVAYLEITLDWDKNEDTNEDVLDEFSRIWTTWLGLTTLKIRGFATVQLDFDGFLSGVPTNSLGPLKEELGLLTESALTLASLHETVEKYRSRPGISNLKHLQDFDCSLPSSMTDIGGYFGIALACPHLQRAYIRGDPENVVSAECLEFIRSALGLAAVIDL